MAMKVTVLVEGTRLRDRRDLIAEHGLSIHIRHDGQQTLFDTGATDAFSRNAERLGVSIQEVGRAVISHHHSDHGGGLAHFLKTNAKAKVYLRGPVDADHYTRRIGILSQRIGLDKRLFQKYPDRFEFVNELTEISPDVFILTEIGDRYPQPEGDSYLLAKEGDTRRLDTFEHDLILVMQEEEGLVAFTGCSHRGILNLADAVSRQFPGHPIKALFGDFHQPGLKAGSKRRLEDIGRELLKYPVGRVYTGHCTGVRAFRVLKQVMGAKLQHLPAGSTVEIWGKW